MGDHFYLIVMPNTLHYLIPCLGLLPENKTIVLIFNGANNWEKELIRKQFPNRAEFSLSTLPNSSVNHGPVINLLLFANQENFGIIDHDLYIFDPTLLNQTHFSSKQSMRAVFKGVNPHSDMHYPFTCYLFFNTRVIKNIMRQYNVDARIYRSPGKRAKQELAKVGLDGRAFIKEYINYFDTLHVILGISYALDYKVDYFDKDKVFHLGGTSMGSQYSNDLIHMYMSMRFLEYLNNPTVTAKYRRFLTPFTTSQQIWQKLTVTPKEQYVRQMLDLVIQNLRSNDAANGVLRR